MEKINLIFTVFLLCLTLFLGFAIGRFGDKFFGYTKLPHHWIYGVILLGLGVGLFISDLNDFLIIPVTQFYELPHIWKFWSLK
jgi:putative Mn2+ efflux pump MntP